MAVEIPTSFDYRQYVDMPGEQIRGTLLADSVRNPRWRGDSSDRLHGGARRTYLPNSRHLLDRLLFAGGTEDFRRVMSVCTIAANRLMSNIGVSPWQVNRIVINKMPPSGKLAEHPDPDHFEGGVVVVGAGEASLHYRVGEDEAVIDDPFENLVFIPPGVPHWVTNADQERVSVVAINDAQLRAGVSAIHQKISNVIGSEIHY